jgi:hypothetical protein
MPPGNPEGTYKVGVLGHFSRRPLLADASGGEDFRKRFEQLPAEAELGQHAEHESEEHHEDGVKQGRHLGVALEAREKRRKRI